MREFWWKLPGPSLFVERVVQDLRDGRSVALLLPLFSPSGLDGAISSAISDANGLHWMRLSIARQGSSTPVDFLYSSFSLDSRPDSIRNARALLELDSFSNHLIWLEGMSAEKWPAWKEFLIEFEYASRACSALNRAVFCIPLAGIFALDAPKPDVCLSHHKWSGFVSNLDMLVYTTKIMTVNHIPDLQKRVAIAVITNLSLWDPDFADRLACETIVNIFHPNPILQSYARERGWDEKSTNPCWEHGTIDEVDGRQMVHSAALAIPNATEELSARIWSAEIGVLFPYVERMRRRLLDKLGASLNVPYTTRFGVKITDIRELEIGHIYSQIGNDNNTDPDIRSLVKRLTDIRNCLSHLDPLPLNILLCNEIVQYSEYSL